MNRKFNNIAASLKQSKIIEVHLWAAEIDDITNHIERRKELLSVGEQERAAAFRFKKDYIRYIFAHELLRLVLNLYTGLPSEDLTFYTNAGGKPFLKENKGFEFNLSHTKNLAVVAVARGFQIGVDVEKCVPFDDMDDVSRTIMTCNEYKRFKAFDKDRQLSFFYRCWVRKEALVKARGTGIEENLSEIPVFEDLEADSNTLLFPNQKKNQEVWRIKDLDLDYDYTGAVCLNTETFEVKLFQKNIVNQLLREFL